MGQITNATLRPVAELTPYERNAKQHSDEQVRKIADSIREFGFLTPVLIDTDGNIIAGHGRVMAAKLLGMPEVPCVSVEGLSDEQRRAYILADNRLTELGEWDTEILNTELSALNAAGFDVTLTGFEMPKLEMEPETASEDPADEVPDLEDAESTAQPGEIYRLGRHRLMCGDATSGDDVELLLDGQKAALALTDPPYGISIVKKDGHIGSYGQSFRPVLNDDSTDAARLHHAIAARVSENQIIFGGNYFADFLPPSSCWLVWDKANNGNDFADAELAYTSFKKSVKLYRWPWCGWTRSGERADELPSRVHPTQKPVGLLAQILEDHTDSGDLVLDCFGGSGSTLIACEKTGRTCCMMEMEPYYVDVIIQRWEKYTGRKAERVEKECQ